MFAWKKKWGKIVTPTPLGLVAVSVICPVAAVLIKKAGYVPLAD